VRSQRCRVGRRHRCWSLRVGRGHRCWGCRGTTGARFRQRWGRRCLAYASAAKFARVVQRLRGNATPVRPHASMARGGPAGRLRAAAQDCSSLGVRWEMGRLASRPGRARSRRRRTLEIRRVFRRSADAEIAPAATKIRADPFPSGLLGAVRWPALPCSSLPVRGNPLQRANRVGV
jgi:hypothetical protein